ncbi:hypothetical protein [Occultella kanbiaonis]|uniref:hypothetical protein n=1 Tax=Occultella kanbiaonis TaxID=2675754 RepID=UPI0013D37C23|nr:hypothetical protein [Occultella kanbiaonis]
MAVTGSVGYEGTVGYDTHARISSKGARYTVGSRFDLRPTVKPGADRTITIAAGTATGYAIEDTLTETDVPFGTPSSGTRYDMLVLRRTWADGPSAPVVITGGSSPLVPSRMTGPGEVDDQPIVLVANGAGTSGFSIVADLRVLAGDGGLTAVHERALDYLGELAGTSVSIQGKQWDLVVSPTLAPSWRELDVTRVMANTIRSSFASVTYDSSWTASSMQVIRDGGQVFSQGRIQYNGSGGIPAGVHNGVAVLPGPVDGISFRPTAPRVITVNSYVVSGTTTTYFPDSVLQIGTNGVMHLSNRHGGPITGVTADFSFWI